jgi:hypothetical protein
MACYYCWKDGFTDIPDVGPCVVCSKAVCSEPPRRPDRTFHASASACDGHGALVCRYHMNQHATTNGRQVADCFPSQAVAAGNATLTVLAREMAEDRTAGRLLPPAVGVLNAFLNFVMPGHLALAEAIDRSPDRRVRELAAAGLDEVGEVPIIELAPEFWSQGAMDRVAALAGRTLIQAWSARTDRPRAPRLDWLGARVRAVLTLVSGIDPDEGIRTHGTMLIEALAPRGVLVAPSLVRALRYTDVPHSPAAVAQWIMGEAELVGVRAEMEAPA